jgi:hypothetical protein
MTDYATTDLVSLVLHEDDLLGKTTDLIWWISAPYVLIEADGPTALQKTMTDIGRTAWAQGLGGIISGSQISYFKLGEGGWGAYEVSGVVGQGTGINTVSGTLDGPPVVPNSVTVDAGTGRVATDTPNSPWDGTGTLTGTGVSSGAINYKTNVWTVTYTGIVSGSQDVTITRDHRGRDSQVYTEDIASGDGSTTLFTGLNLSSYPVIPFSVRIVFENYYGFVIIDNGSGDLELTVFPGVPIGAINYDTGAITLNDLAPTVLQIDQRIRADYRVYGIPNEPGAERTDLVADTDSTLATMQKALTPGVDMVFSGAGTKEVVVTLGLTTAEGNDDGTGNPPSWTEGGLYSEGGILLVYFTMPGVRKTSSDTFQHQLKLGVRI